MSKIYIDITNIANHQGTISGITRVEQKIIDHYQADQQASLVVWSKQQAYFVEVAKSDIATILSTIDKFAALNPQTPPSNLKSHLSKRLESTARALIPAGRLRTALKSRLKPQDLPIPVESKPCQFQPQSLLLVPCGAWARPDYIEALKGLSQQGVKLAQIVHDMIPLMMPEMIRNPNTKRIFANYMFQILPIADHVLFISKNTAKDAQAQLEQHSLCLRGKSHVFRLGDNPTVKTTGSQPGFIDQRPYILMVGTIEPRKNHQLLLKVYRLAKRNKIELPHLYIAGRIGWKVDSLVRAIRSDVHLKSKITIIERATDRQLGWLYQQARLSVFPSWYEGWGLPIAESLAFGKVTLASNTSSMPEVGGRLVDYFSPDSPQQLLDLLVNYQDQDRLTARQAEIKAGFKSFSWSQSVEQLDKILRDS